MPVTLRDLLPRVMLYRPDMDDAKGMFCLTNAAKRLARNGWILRKVVPPIPMLNNQTPNIGEGSIVRIEDMKGYKVPDYCRYAGEWDPETNTPFLGEATATPSGSDSVVALPKFNWATYFISAAMADMGDGKLAVFGDPVGAENSITATTKCFIYDTKTGVTTGPFLIPGNRYGGAQSAQTSSPYMRKLIALKDGRVWVVGGTSPTNTAGTYAPEYETWFIDRSGNITKGPTLPQSSRWTSNAKVQRLSDGGILLASNDFSTATVKNAVNYYYKLSADGLSLTLIKQFNSDTYGHHPFFAAQIPLGDDKFLVYPRGYVQSAYVFVNNNPIVFDAKTGKIEVVAKSSIVRFRFSNALGGLCVAGCSIGNGKCVIAGSDLYNTSGEGRAVEVFDLETKSFTLLASLQTMTSSPQDRVIYPNISRIGATKVLVTGFWSQTGADTGIKNNNVYCVLDTVDGTYRFAPDSQTTNSWGYDQGFTNIAVGGKVYTAIPVSGLAHIFEYFDTALFPNVGNWYGVSKKGNTEISGINEWDQHDVVYSDGNTWVQVKWHEATQMAQLNQPTVSFAGQYSTSGEGYPINWWQDNGVVQYRPWPKYGTEYPVRMTVSYSLDDPDLEKLDLPVDAQEVLVDGAIAMICELPGEGQDKQVAAQHMMQFNIGMTKMKVAAVYGYGGSPAYSTGATFGPSGHRGSSFTW